MSRLAHAPITVKPSPNIYTGLALTSMLATLAALSYVAYLWFSYYNK